MGMRSLVQAAVRQAFVALGDLVVSGTYVARADVGTRNVETGETVYPTTTYPIKKLAVVRFTEAETDKDPSLSTTQKLIFANEELPASVKPGSEDQVNDAEGRVWEVVKLVSAPTDLVTILAVRST